MAFGLGALFGLRLPQTFNSPYRATDPSELWRRWHMSLSTVMRDYLFTRSIRSFLRVARRCVRARYCGAERLRAGATSPWLKLGARRGGHRSRYRSRADRRRVRVTVSVLPVLKWRSELPF